MKAKQKKQFAPVLAYLRETRLASKLTLRETAAKMKVPPSWVGKAETGDRRLDLVEYIRLCDVIGADPAKGLKLAMAEKSAPAKRR